MSLLSRLAVQTARAYGILSAADKTKVVADYLVVAGGGGAGDNLGGGGGAGGLLTSTTTLSTLNTYSITVGAGGVGGASGDVNGSNGSNSVISGTGLTTITAIGGGGGAGNSAANSGGSGGGGSSSSGSTGGTGTSGQGYAGGTTPSGTYWQAASGGGGAGAAGTGRSASASTGGNGGNGIQSSISGTATYYAGGGAGGAGTGFGTGTVGTAGLGGGGVGRLGDAGGKGGNGGVNLGGGGGGGGTAGGDGGDGGSGIVIISYTSATPKFVGGTITTSGGKQIHTFTSSGTLSPLTPITASYLVVAGGGGGALGGGGAGGLQTGSTTIYSGATYVVTVGGGGTAGTVTSTNGGQGNNSVLSGTGLTTLTSIGGGYGGSSGGVNGGNGGSGGGGGSGNAGGTATSGQGNNGGAGIPLNASPYSGGGGGGAGATGGTGSSSAGGSGGNGSASSITGTSVTYAGGGGGGVYLSGYSGGTAGTGGGGAGASGAAGSSGTPNLGGGGGGAGNTYNGGAGGSGVVIISYAGSQQFNGGLVTSSGGNTIHTFTSTGALTPLTNNLNNSLRFRSSASANLSRTPTITSNRTTWTWSAWVKRSNIGAWGALFSSGSSSSSFEYITFRSDDTLQWVTYTTSTQANLITTQVFRDPSAWYHLVVAVDTTQATAANRVKMYVNGNQITAFGTSTYPTLNYSSFINLNQLHNIGKDQSGDYFDGYMTDINFIDGQQLEPYYFGNNDANGVWKPIQYKGTYGTNGFYLTFGNTTSTTTLGYDSSPNGNNWTCNNISLTAGTTYDAMTDVPTNTSATVANYAVMNPLQNPYSSTFSNANMTVATASGSGGIVFSSMAMSAGKYYWEVTLSSGTSGDIGIFKTDATLSSSYLLEQAYGYSYVNNGQKFNNNSGTAYGASYTTNDVIGVAFDADNGTLTFYKNGTSQGTAFTSLTNGPYSAAVADTSGIASSTFNVNFGQRPFAYSVPSGYVALNTYNLPTPTILQGNKYMDATLYTGTGTDLVIANQGQFKPDFVWTKCRSNAVDHCLVDAVRGGNKILYSDLTNAEDTSTFLSSFNSNGYTISSNAGGGGITSGRTYVGWQWQAGQGSTSSNTSGSITSTVSVNTTAGFSVVTYTGNGTAGATIGHGLGVAPKMVIVKVRSTTDNWYVYHASLGNTQAVLLNGTQATSATGAWNNTTPTSTLITLGSTSAVNTNAATFVAYCWAEISGFSKFGSYTGNGSTDGPFIYTGFRPKFVMIKVTSTTENWYILDSSRNTYNVEDKYLLANASDTEGTYTFYDFLSNGFKIRNTGGAGAGLNASGQSYIVVAFAEHPFKNANAR